MRRERRSWRRPVCRRRRRAAPASSRRAGRAGGPPPVRSGTPASLVLSGGFGRPHCRPIRTRGVRVQRHLAAAPNGPCVRLGCAFSCSRLGNIRRTGSGLVPTRVAPPTQVHGRRRPGCNGQEGGRRCGRKALPARRVLCWLPRMETRVRTGASRDHSSTLSRHASRLPHPEIQESRSGSRDGGHRRAGQGDAAGDRLRPARHPRRGEAARGRRREEGMTAPAPPDRGPGRG